MKPLYKIFIISIVIITFYYHAKAQEYEGLILGNGVFHSKALAIAKNSENDFFITGSFAKDYKSSEDIFFLQTDSTGSVKLFETYGGKYHDRAFAITKLNNDNYLITGESWGGFNYESGRDNLFFLKVDFTGLPLNEHSYSHYHRDQGHKSIKTYDDKLCIVGYSKSFDDKIGDIYLIKTEIDGKLIWEKTFDYNQSDYGFDILELENHNLLILGTAGGFFNTMQDDWKSHDADILIIETDKNGTQLFSKKFGTEKHDFCRKIFKSPNGGYYILGSTQSYGSGSFDIFLLKIDKDYNEEWHKTYGGEYFDYGNSITLSTDKKSLFIAGTTYLPQKGKETDIIMLKTDLSGEIIVSRNFGGAKNETAYDIISTQNGGCIIAGESFSYTDTNLSNIYLLFLNKLGNPLQTSESRLYKANIFPNPAKNIVYINIISGKPTTVFEIEIIDFTGRIIAKHKAIENFYPINTSNISNGIYVVRIKIDNNIICKKLIINNN